jgi:hypothetical protein
LAVFGVIFVSWIDLWLHGAPFAFLLVHVSLSRKASLQILRLEDRPLEG